MELRADQRRYLKLEPLGSALGSLLDQAGPLGVRRIRVEEALGHVCAKDYLARWDVPPKDVSAMDGYAVRACDLPAHGSARLFRVVGRASALGGGRLRVGRGEACYVSTGSPLPRGADTVVRVEETRFVDKQSVMIGVALPKGKNVSLRGEDIRRGQPVARKGVALGPGPLSLLVYFGFRRILVYRKPRVGVLSVGDELADYLGGRRVGAQSFNNNAWLILSYLRHLGFDTEYFGVVGDDEGAVRAKVEGALRRVDVLVTLGGTSVGLHDTTPDAVSTVGGARMLFHGLRAVPIKPVGAAVAGGPRKRFVVLLPGHIVSAALGFHVVCVPLLAKLSGAAPQAFSAKVGAKLGSAIENRRNLEALYLVRLRWDGSEHVAEPLGWGSNLMGHVSEAAGYVRLGPNQALGAGDRVVVELLGPQTLLGLG